MVIVGSVAGNVLLPVVEFRVHQMHGYNPLGVGLFVVGNVSISKLARHTSYREDESVRGHGSVGNSPRVMVERQ